MPAKNPYENSGYPADADREKKGRAVVTAQIPEEISQEKKKTAVALEYDLGDRAPKIIASGKGVLAEKIIEKAQESQVPIHRDERLANTLSRLEIGDFIPPELYEVVAQVLMFVDRLDNIKEKIMKER